MRDRAWKIDHEVRTYDKEKDDQDVKDGGKDELGFVIVVEK